MNRLDGDVLIVGAGPAGLTLANDLVSRGISVRVIDPLPEPVRTSRAHGMLGRTLIALDKLGLAEPMLAAAKRPTPVLREYFGRKLVAEFDLATVPRDPYPATVPIFQQRVVRVLEAALAARGHRIEWSTRLVTFTMDDEGVVARVDRNGIPDTIKSKWIVGCDGGRSTVRKTLTAEFPGESSGLQGLFCECDLDWKRSRDIWWTWQDKEGLVATIYNDFTEKWHILIMDLKKRGSASDSSDFERAGVLLRRMSGDHDVRLSNPVWIQGDFTPSQRIAEHFVIGHAVLAGDAAHVFSSVAGHGVHCAIEDALNLGWKLGLTISGLASPLLLQTYDTERRGHANDVNQETRWIQRFMNLSPSLRNVLWAAFFFIGKHLRSISATFNRQAEKLISDYGKSPLSRQDFSTKILGVRAGLHVLDAECWVGGRPSHLLQIIRGKLTFCCSPARAPTPQIMDALRIIEGSVISLSEYLHVHYVFPSQGYANEAGLGEDDPRVIIDGLEKIESEFGMRKPEVIYIRPDGYIGLRTQELHPQQLLNYLGKIYRALESDAFSAEISGDLTREKKP